MMHSTTTGTPAGPLTVLVNADVAVRAAGWGTDVETLLALVHPNLRETVTPLADLGPVSRAVAIRMRSAGSR